MPDSVIDASALAAVAFHEPEADDVRERLRGNRLFAPDLLLYEMANAARNRAVREPDHRELFAFALAAALRVPISLVDVNHTLTLSLALETGLTTYDASYLWLAETLDAELVSLDRDLNAVYAARSRRR